MTLVDSTDFEKRISELERSVGELQAGLFSHKVCIESLMQGNESRGNQLRELREELRGRAKDLEGKLRKPATIN